MKYSKNLISKFPKFYLAVFIFLFFSIAYINKERLYRSIVNVNLWSLYIELANDKADKLTIKKLTHGNPTMKLKFEKKKNDS